MEGELDALGYIKKAVRARILQRRIDKVRYYRCNKWESGNRRRRRDEVDELDSSRLENLHWCSCTHCCVMPSLRECKCCRECSNLLEEKLDSINCISEHEEFVQLCLNKIVLNTAFIQYRRTKKNYKRVKSMTNK